MDIDIFKAQEKRHSWRDYRQVWIHIYSDHYIHDDELVGIVEENLRTMMEESLRKKPVTSPFRLNYKAARQQTLGETRVKSRLIT